MLTGPKSDGLRARSGGFTLVELMIALVLGLVVIAAAIAVLLSNKQAYVTNDALSEIQDGSRVAFELLARDFRQAGLTACGNSGRVANVLKNGPANNGGTATVWWADFGNAVHGYDDTQTDPAIAFGSGPTDRKTGTDSVQIIGASDSGLSVNTYNAATDSITLNEPSSSLQSGDIIVVCDPTHAAITQITSYTNSTVTLLHATNVGTPGNCSTNLDFPTVCSSTQVPSSFGTNSQIATLQASDWYIGNNAQGGQSLYRVALNNVGGVPTQAHQEMVRGVTGMQLKYHLNGGLDFLDAGGVTATQWSSIDGVQMRLTFQSTDKYAGSDAKPLVRTLTTTVALRNRMN